MTGRAKTRKKRENQRNTKKNQSENEYTLPEIWMDSFDKFIAEKQALREKNVLKPKGKVRTLYNQDSSLFESPPGPPGKVKKRKVKSAAPKGKRKTVLKERKIASDIVHSSTPVQGTKNNKMKFSTVLSPVWPNNVAADPSKRNKKPLMPLLKDTLSSEQESTVWKPAFLSDKVQSSGIASPSVVLIQPPQTKAPSPKPILKSKSRYWYKNILEKAQDQIPIKPVEKTKTQVKEVVKRKTSNFSEKISERSSEQIVGKSPQQLVPKRKTRFKEVPEISPDDPATGNHLTPQEAVKRRTRVYSEKIPDSDSVQTEEKSPPKIVPKRKTRFEEIPEINEESPPPQALKRKTRFLDDPGTEKRLTLKAIAPRKTRFRSEVIPEKSPEKIAEQSQRVTPQKILVEFPRKSVKTANPTGARKTVAFKDASMNKSLEIVQPRATIVIPAGKWRKSLAIWRKSHMSEVPQGDESLGSLKDHDTTKNESIIQPGRRRVTMKILDSIQSIAEIPENSERSSDVILVPQSDDETYNQSLPGSQDIRPSRHYSISRSVSAIESGNLSFDESSSRKQFRRQTHSILRYRRTSSVREEVGAYINGDLTHRGLVLRYCGQSEPLDFNEVYSESVLRNCRKVGEGVYSEVFMYKNAQGKAIVLKVIPIEGGKIVNGEIQKKFEEILSEIIITGELSKLKNGQEFRTEGFVDLVNVKCVQGRYPEHLIDLWELYRDNHGTDNDHPEIFDDDQLYIVLELGNGGQDLEAFNFKNALQAYSAFIQVAVSLAVAEQKFEFEHRDLHWGNILLSNTDEKEIEFVFKGKLIAIPAHGVRVTIIDYTLSRMVHAGECQYNDLSQDEELFSASGDYQFDIYRLMRNQLDNQWERYDPYNNVLWLHYIIDKMINGARYRLKQSKKHRDAIQDMMQLRDELLDFKSASEYAHLLK